MKCVHNNVYLYNGDCRNVFNGIDSESVDLLVTDCPFKTISVGSKTPKGGIFLTREAKAGKMFRHNDIEFSEWLPEVYRILKQDTHCYIMINARNLAELQQKAEKVGFQFQNILIWYKNNATPNKYYLNAYEMILMLRKGKAKNINNMGTKNVLQINNIIGNKNHPTEKPVELMKILIENSTVGGDLVIDPFMGAGSTGIACKELNRDFIGIEIDEKYFKIAKERIEDTEETKDKSQINIFDMMEE